MQGYKNVGYWVHETDHAAFVEEAHRQSKREGRVVSLAEVQRQEYAKSAQRFRNKVKTLATRS